MRKTNAEAATVTVKKSGKKMKGKIKHMMIQPSDNGGFHTETHMHPSTEADKKEPWGMQPQTADFSNAGDMQQHVQNMFPSESMPASEDNAAESGGEPGDNE
jgi:hypothetical protein